MAPKRTTRSTPATKTTTTTSVTNAQLKTLIDQGVAAALVARDADRSMNGNDSWERIFKKRKKMKPNQQNQARECEEHESKSQQKVNPEKSRVKPEAKSEEILNGRPLPI
ncbi:hypothetical protein Tco_0105287 [Tanacetum coccineum]